MKIRILIALMVISMLVLTACGSGASSASYADGVYTGQSETHTGDDGSDTDAGSGYGVVQITIDGGAITDCTFQTYETDGTLKAEDYGKQDGEVANRDYYNKAQKAVAACDQYALDLIGEGSLDGIDAISGATINYNEFCEAVEDALSQAEE